MLIRGEALMHSFTLEYSAHGEAGLWDVSVKSPGCAPLQRQTYDETPYNCWIKCSPRRLSHRVVCFQNERRRNQDRRRYRC